MRKGKQLVDTTLLRFIYSGHSKLPFKHSSLFFFFGLVLPFFLSTNHSWYAFRCPGFWAACCWNQEYFRSFPEVPPQIDHKQWTSFPDKHSILQSVPSQSHYMAHAQITWGSCPGPANMASATSLGVSCLGMIFAICRWGVGHATCSQ